MKERVLDVLMYLFENYLEDSPDEPADQESLRIELLQAGFPSIEVTKAFDWLQDLSTISDSAGGGLMEPCRYTSHRILSAIEMKKLDTGCQRLLLQLEQRGVIDSWTRELVIDRVMALEGEEIGLDELRWVVLMVLSNHSGYDHSYAMLEDIVLNDEYRYEHVH